ncbi:MAG: hypothetical protein ACJ786_30125 [Catenulispora sp.]
MDETLHESDPDTAGGEPPAGDSATAEPGLPRTAHFAPVERPDQRPDQGVSPAQPVDDGRPGGEVPESSGFSWRLPGQQAPAQQVQGGIPNEFDHLFRDAPEDGRRSLLPDQGPIGISVPGTVNYRQGGSGRAVSGGQGGQAGLGGPGGPGGQTGSGAPGLTPTQALPPAGATGQQAPAYQPPTQDQVGYSQQGPPSRAYDSTGYQAQAQGYSSDPDQHTQAIPRVSGGRPYGPGQGPGGPDLLLATGPGKRQSKTTLLVALGVFVVLIVVAAVAFSGGGSKPKTDNAKKSTTSDTPAAPSTSVSAPPGVDPEAKKQADAIWQIIALSHELRSRANTAVSAVEQCKNMADNKQTFTDVAAKRQAQADAVKGQVVDKLPGGQKLASDLITSWQLSAESENDYVAWTTDNLTCTGKPGSNDNRNKAQSAGQKAGTAKNDAVKDWNAFASKFGEQTIGVNDL